MGISMGKWPDFEYHVGKWLKYDRSGYNSSHPSLGSPLDLGNPWRPLATLGDMPENGQNDHFQACRQWSPRNSCRCFWQLFDFLSRTIGSVMLLDTWKHMSQKKKSYSLSLRVLVPRHQNSGAPNVTDGLVKGSCPHLLLMRLTHC